MLIRNVSLLHGKKLEFLPRTSVRISGKRIVKVSKDLAPGPGERVLDCEGLLMMPGLVNSHTHIGDSIGKDVGIDLSVDSKIHPVGGFKQKILKNSEASHLVNFMRNSCLSMIRKGITTFIDFREGGLEGIGLLKDAVRGLPIRPVILGRPNYYQDLRLVRKNLALPGAQRQELLDVIRACDGLGISGPNEFSDSALKFFAGLKAFRAIHSAETSSSDAISQKATERTETRRAMLSRPNLLVHMTFASRSDLLLAARNKVGIVVCPRANGALAEGIPDVAAMTGMGCTVTIGTDNVMVNHPDMFREMDYLWKVSMGMSKARIPPRQVLQMATSNAGASLGGRIGMIQRDSLADCIFMEKHSIDLEPMHNPHAAIVHRASESTIRAVMFEGEVVHGKI
ncbi:MAG: amidohydrolase family protein [Thaumarchaeota archaeon]|nr:amidohydrolase family protein [Nitrososphaerota archaeon]